MLWPILLALLVIFGVTWMLRRGRNFRNLPQAGHAISLINLSNVEIWDYFRVCTEKYGDRYVINGFVRDILHTSRPSDIELILSHPRNITKGLAYSFIKPWLGTGLLISTGAKWQKRRKILTPTFHFNILKNFAVIIEEKSRDLVRNLQAEGKEQEALEVNVIRVISDCTLYTICETAMGTKLDSNHTDRQRAYKAAVLSLGLMVLKRLPKIWNWWDFLYYRLPEGQKFQQTLDIVQSFADDVIAKKKKEKMSQHNDEEDQVNDVGTKKRLAMLDLLLEAEMKGEIDLEGIREEVNTFMFEGHDTTAMALSFGFMVLAEHPDVQEKLFEELSTVVGDSDRSLTSADLAHLKYLEAVIKEILRLYPSVPFITRTTSEDFQMGDIFVKKGSELAVHIYDLHRRADLFENPGEFKPERFLENTLRHPYAYVPFSAGPRNCIGQKFAMQEMKSIISEVIRGFRLSPSPRNETPRIQSDLVLRPEKPIYVNFTRRQRL